MKIRATLIATLLIFTPSHSAFAEQDRQEFIEALFAAFNAHDVEKLKGFYSEHAVVYTPEKCDPTVGRDAIGASYAEMFEQIPDVHDQLDVVVTQGGKTAIVFTASSKASGAEFELPIAAFLTIKNDLVVEDRVFFNSEIILDCNKD